MATTAKPRMVWDGERTSGLLWSCPVRDRTIMYHYVHALSMARPRAPNCIQVYVPKSVVEAVDSIRGFMSRSEWIRRAIHEALMKEAGR